MDEPVITINGHRLTVAQSMAVRVAITAYHAEMIDPEVLGSDLHGRFMTKTYRASLTEVIGFIVEGK